MPGHMKMHPTEIQIHLGKDRFVFKGVPKGKLETIIKSLRKYKDDSVEWRSLAQGRIKKQGGEPAYMLRVCRERLKLTQTALAKKLDLKQSNISQMENGKRSIGKIMAKKFAKVFDVDYRVFL